MRIAIIILCSTLGVTAIHVSGLWLSFKLGLTWNEFVKMVPVTISTAISIILTIVISLIKSELGRSPQFGVVTDLRDSKLLITLGISNITSRACFKNA
jgi:hypothetical protein